MTTPTDPRRSPGGPVTARTAKPRTLDGRFIPRGQIPGADGCEPPAGPVTVCGVVRTPKDAARVGGSPIGLALALEWVAAGKGDEAAA